MKNFSVLESWMFWLESWHKFKSPSMIKKKFSRLQIFLFIQETWVCIWCLGLLFTQNINFKPRERDEFLKIFFKAGNFFSKKCWLVVMSSARIF
jgi:hypothetical protein